MEGDAVPPIAQETEVLIAGAGPVGLALALELQRFGIRFRIVERNAQRSTTSKALGLQPRLSEVFAILGVAGKFFARGFAGVRALNLNTSDKKLLRLQIQQPPNVARGDVCQPRLIIIPQSETEEILETTLAERGHTVERRRELIRFDQTHDLVSAVVRDESGADESIRARFLVSCEGAHSVIRKLAQFTFTGATLPLRFLLADVTVDWDLPDNEVQAWFHRHGTCAALPFGGKRWRVIVECAAAGTNDTAPEVTLELVQNLMVERTGRNDVRLRDPLWLSDFRINTRMVDRFRDRRVFVAGDAAHIHSPAGGQGIATGIQDAANLAWKLAVCLRQGAPDSLLDSYDEERKPIAREVLSRTTTVSSILFSMSPFARLFRERLLAPILRTRFAQQRLFTKLSQLEMNYRRRSLSVDSGGGSSRVRPGDRVPDVMFIKEGEEVSLFELIGRRGMVGFIGWSESNRRIIDALAAVGIEAFIVLPKGADATDLSIEDVHGDFVRLYGAQGSFLYLIRPDGHVGLFQGRAEALALADYLKKIRAAGAVERAFEL